MSERGIWLPMEIGTCRQCGRVFMKRDSDLCMECARREEEVFLQVREYLEEHRGATLMELSGALGVSEDLVSRLIEQGRLVMSGAAVSRCESCGTVVAPGQRLCLRCRVTLDQSLRAAADTLRTSLREGLPGSEAKRGTYYTRPNTDRNTRE